MAYQSLHILLDRDGKEPIYRQLIRQIRMQIESEELALGTRLPASRDLAKELEVSRISVVNAYSELRSSGYLTAHAGRGTFVAHPNSPNGNGHTQSNHYIDNPAPNQSIRDLLKLAQKPDVINFSHGAPPTEFFPVKRAQEAIQTVLERDGAQALNYEDAEGYYPLRVAVRDYVSALGIECRPDNVLITGGAQQGIDLVTQALLSEGDILVTSEPTYIGVLDIARVRRIQVQGIPMDNEGIRLDILENFIHEHRPRLMYLMPSFHNPTAQVMSVHRRRQLLRLAYEYQIPILEDGVYQAFRFEGEDLPPLKALDEHGMVIHINAFTKMLLPGMRIGYLIANGTHYERITRIKQAADLSTSGLNQRTIHLMLQWGILAQQLEHNNRELRRRRDAAIDALEEFMPDEAGWNVPEGGLYIWLEIPKFGPTASQLFATAIQKKVAFAIGNTFYTNGNGCYRIRINYSMQPPDLIREGFRRLGEAWHELASNYADYQGMAMV